MPFFVCGNNVDTDVILPTRKSYIFIKGVDVMKKHIKNIIIICLSIILVFLIYQVARLYKEIPSSQYSNDHIETERKFLLSLDKLPDDMASRADIFDLVQTYISYSPEMRVRKVNGTYYYFTLKRPKDDIGLSREEIEFQISNDEYDELLKKQVGETILKTRYQFYEDNIYISVDVYSGNLTGLAVAEVEFGSVEESEKYVPPSWFGADITSDKRYKNANLEKNGFPNP